MNQTNLEMLYYLLAAFLVLTIGVFIWGNINKEAVQINPLVDVKERTDILISDRLPLNCFLPPELTEKEFNRIKDEMEAEDEELFKRCFVFSEGSLFGGKSELQWELIEELLPYGVKMNGYCYNESRKDCVMANSEFYGWEGLDTQRRNIDFGSEQHLTVGTNFNVQEYISFQGSPSIFLVKPEEEAKLSVYGGIFLRGNKTVEKVTAHLRDNTNKIISDIVGVERSCYYGENWECYKSCMKDSATCREECDCYLNQSYYDENPLTICNNYCDSRDFKRAGETSQGCKDGCATAKSKGCYMGCFINSGNSEYCLEQCSCEECEGLDESMISRDLICDGIVDADEMKGCLKMLEIENSVFSIVPVNYTLFKIGDVTFDEDYRDYRGILWASANITTKESFPGENCYNPNKYSCYYECCEQTCTKSNMESSKGCIIEDSTCLEQSDGKCEKLCNCSTNTQKDNEETFVLCRNFCSSRDGYYGEVDSIKDCLEGCDMALKSYETTYGSYSRKITIQEMAGKLLVDYPVKIILNTKELISLKKMNSDCSDIRFLDSKGEDTIEYWLNSITCDNEETEIWVKVPIVEPKSSAILYLKYGNSALSSESNGKKVFSGFWSWDKDEEGWTFSGEAGYVHRSIINCDCVQGSACTEDSSWTLDYPLEEGNYKIYFKARPAYVASGKSELIDILSGSNYEGKLTVSINGETKFEECLTDNSDWSEKEIVYSGTLSSLTFVQSECGDTECVAAETQEEEEISQDEKDKVINSERIYVDDLVISKYFAPEPQVTIDEESVIVSSAPILGNAFESGFEKFEELALNTVPLENPYIWKTIYEVFSNPVLILDWNNEVGIWNYPCDDDWEKICLGSPSLNKSVEMTEGMAVVKTNYHFENS